jgi:hypothetical protein
MPVSCKSAPLQRLCRQFRLVWMPKTVCLQILVRLKLSASVKTLGARALIGSPNAPALEMEFKGAGLQAAEPAKSAARATTGHRGLRLRSPS